MTVRTIIMNAGNHPNDMVEVVRDNGNVTLKHGEYTDLLPSFSHMLGAQKHGSGPECLMHDPFLIKEEAAMWAVKAATVGK